MWRVTIYSYCTASLFGRKRSSCETSSQIFSRVFIQLVARWQFCSTTHEPSSIALFIISAAIGPWQQTIMYTLLPHTADKKHVAHPTNFCMDRYPGFEKHHIKDDNFFHHLDTSCSMTLVQKNSDTDTALQTKEIITFTSTTHMSNLWT